MTEEEAERCCEEGARLAEEGRIAEAITDYERAAQAGHPLAQLNLGQLLFDKVTPPDTERAIYWSQAAAAQGESCAAWNLALYWRNAGDPFRHRRWLKRAAELGDDEAAALLSRRQ